MEGLKTVDYYWINDMLEDNQYLEEDWERKTAKSAMITALWWSRREDALWRERRKMMKLRGIVIETKPLGL